jgi:hypothetical protein
MRACAQLLSAGLAVVEFSLRMKASFDRCPRIRMHKEAILMRALIIIVLYFFFTFSFLFKCRAFERLVVVYKLRFFDRVHARYLLSKCVYTSVLVFPQQVNVGLLEVYKG